MPQRVGGTMLVIVVLFGLCVVLTLDKTLPARGESTSRQYLTDLPTFQAAAAAQARGENPYDHAVLVRNVTVPHDHFNIYPYVYTPALAMVLRPVAFLPLHHLQVLWLLMLSLATAVFIALALSLLCEPSFAGSMVAAWMNDRTPFQKMALAIALFLLMPFYTSFMHGQVEAATALGVTASLLILARRNPVLAGILFGSVLVVKHAAVVLVLYFVIRGEWRFIVAALVSALVFVLVSMAIVGIGPWMDFIHFVRTLDATRSASLNLSVDTGYNLSLPGLLARLGWISSDSAMKLWPLCFMSLLAAGTLALRKRLADNAPALVFTFYALTSSLIMPFMWSHHVLYALPGIATILSMPLVFRSPWWRTVGIWACTGLVLQLAPGMLPDRMAGKLLDLRLPAALFSTLATIGMAGLAFLCIIAALRRTPSTTVPSS